MAEIRRVLLVEPLAGDRWRSITAYASSLAGMLRAAGVEVDVAEAPWFNPPSLARAARSRWWRSPEVQRAEAGDYDVVHLTDQALAHHVGRFGATPVVVTCHDLMPFTLPGYYASSVERFTKRLFLRRPTHALKRATLVLAVSRYTARELEVFAGVDPAAIREVANSIRPAFHPVMPAEARAALSARGLELPPSPIVFSVGNDRAYKNLEALVRAMAHPALAHANLMRAGTPLPPAILKLAQASGVSRRIVELGSPPDDDLALAYSAADVLAQPSLAEGFGIPVAEALACDLPVVTSDGGALPEVVGAAGEVVPLAPPGFEARFAKALAAVLADRRAGAQLRHEQAAKFAPRAVLPPLLDAYAYAIERKQSLG